jgi:peptidoglycan/LPS O-acetylase OafA/YrhL
MQFPILLKKLTIFLTRIFHADSDEEAAMADEAALPSTLDVIKKSHINKNADGLRGIACFSVVAHHFIAAFLPFLLHKNYPTIFMASDHSSVFLKLCTSPMITLFFNGQFAVVIFFVLSGYVLAAPYYTYDNASLILQRRLLGRFLRLNIPVAVSILLSMLLYSCRKYYNLPASLVSCSQWLSHYFPAGLSYFTGLEDMAWKSVVSGDATFNTALWTLKIEFIGSILLLLFYLLKPREKSSIAWLFFFYLIFQNYGKDSLFLFAIMIGSLLHAVTISKKWVPYVILIALYLGAFQFENRYYDFLPLVGVFKKKDFYETIGAVLLVAPIVQGYGKKFFETRILQFLGRISYSLYLVHFLILCSLSCAFYLFLPHTSLALLLNFFLYSLISILVSVVFYKYVDRPAITISHYFSNFLLNFKTKTLKKSFQK